MDNTCSNCHKEPVYVDMLTGENAEFCSQTCRKQAVESGLVEPCINCRLMPRALVRGQRTLYCGRTCKNENAMKNHLAYKPTQQYQQPTYPQAYPPPHMQTLKEPPVCQYCHKNPVFRNSSYCSYTCRDASRYPQPGPSRIVPGSLMQSGQPMQPGTPMQPMPPGPSIQMEPPAQQPGVSLQRGISIRTGQSPAQQPGVSLQRGLSLRTVQSTTGEQAELAATSNQTFENQGSTQSPDSQSTPEEQLPEQSTTNQQQNQQVMPPISQPPYQSTPTVQIVFTTPGTGSTSPMRSQFPSQINPAEPQIAPIMPPQSLATESFGYTQNDVPPIQPPPPYTRYPNGSQLDEIHQLGEAQQFDQARILQVHQLVDEKVNAAANLEQYHGPQDSSPYFPNDVKITRDENYDDEDPYAFRADMEKPNSTRDETWDDTKWDTERDDPTGK